MTATCLKMNGIEAVFSICRRATASTVSGGRNNTALSPTRCVAEATVDDVDRVRISPACFARTGLGILFQQRHELRDRRLSADRETVDNAVGVYWRICRGAARSARTGRGLSASSNVLV